METRLLESAQDDLREGYRFYEAQAPGLGDYFLDSLQSDLRSLQVYAGIHETVEGFFRMLSRRFPYAIFYQIAENSIDVYAILECRRDPHWITRRLRSAGKGS